MKAVTNISYVQLLLLHLGMAMTIYVAQGTSKFFLFGAVMLFLYLIVKNQNRHDEVLLAAAYVTGFEVFSRMTGGAISYEFAKYSVIGFLTLGMFYKGFNRKSWAYIFFIIFLIPGILFSAMNLNYETSMVKAIAFNLSGPISLAICALYCYNRKMPMKRLQKILLAALLPIVAMAAYLYVYTPNIRDVLTGTQSNFEASGGFGPNQVSTILGLGMFILVSRLFLIKDRLINIIDILLLIFVSYRGIVTFSRGGVLTAGVCSVIFLAILYWRSGVQQKVVLLPKLIAIAVVFMATWAFTSVNTSGLIDKRYANQDAAGRQKEDLSTGRLELINSELEAFYNYPLTGIGVGKIREYRQAQTGRLSNSHNEITRMFSEHGLFGLLGLIILVLTPLIFRIYNRTNVYLFAFMAFWFLTINHSSMRIAAPAFIYGLCLLSLVREKRKHPLHRKQASPQRQYGYFH
ncbi:O-antigen ligase family protein [Altibacter sp. HG106]|nr:O-antigen ligase family protein [Altibacter sp. HG106]